MDAGLDFLQLDDVGRAGSLRNNSEAVMTITLDMAWSSYANGNEAKAHVVRFLEGGPER